MTEGRHKAVSAIKGTVSQFPREGAHYPCGATVGSSWVSQEAGVKERVEARAFAGGVGEAG